MVFYPLGLIIAGCFKNPPRKISLFSLLMFTYQCIFMRSLSLTKGGNNSWKISVKVDKKIHGFFIKNHECMVKNLSKSG